MTNSENNNGLKHSLDKINMGKGKGFIIVSVDCNKKGDDMFNIAEINYINVDGNKLFQGDILVHPFETLDELEKAKDVIRQKIAQKFFAQDYGLWTNGVIYYRIDSNIEARRETIQKACSVWSDGTKRKITFIEISRPQKNYVQIQAGNDNSSDVGMMDKPQNIFLQYNAKIGTILHELGHTIGLWHEHQRADRDKYVKIYEENIIDDYKDQFTQVLDNRIKSMGIPYDYTSIMHYSRDTFSKNKNPTIVPTNPPSANIGESQSPSEFDFAGVIKLY